MYIWSMAGLLEGTSRQTERIKKNPNAIIAHHGRQVSMKVPLLIQTGLAETCSTDMRFEAGLHLHPPTCLTGPLLPNLDGLSHSAAARRPQLKLSVIDVKTSGCTVRIDTRTTT